LADSEEHKRQREAICKQVAENRAAFILSFVTTLFDSSKRAALSKDIKDQQDQCLLTTAASITAAQHGMAERPSRVATLAKLDVPTLFVYGKNDPRIPVEVALGSAIVAKRPEILLLENVAHMAFVEDREFLKPRLFHFVESCYM
jgi:pimeloyl-ACP methyl ester carboxylesterase